MEFTKAVEAVGRRSEVIEDVRSRLELVDPAYRDLSEEYIERMNYIPPYGENYKSVVDEDWQNTEEEFSFEDMVAVHVTDKFPEEGVLKTRYTVERENHSEELPALRDTLHFSMNHPVKLSGLGSSYGDWESRKYAILIPAEDISDRFENFNTVDSFMIGDLELPDSALVITPYWRNLEEDTDFNVTPTLNRHKVGEAGDADVEVYKYREPGQKKNSFRKTVLDRIVDMGYMPMRDGNNSWGDGWHPSDYEEFLERENLEDVKHWDHWTHKIDNPVREIVGVLAKGETSIEGWDVEDFVEDRLKRLDKARNKMPEGYESYRKYVSWFEDKARGMAEEGVPEYSR